jgi:hypothetical protein
MVAVAKHLADAKAKLVHADVDVNIVDAIMLASF